MSIATRFWEKVVRKEEDECWPWIAHNHKGYGSMYALGRKTKATHVSLFLQNGTWPTKHVLHSCDNPCCVNPKHLNEGSHEQNMKEAAERLKLPQGEDRNLAKISNAAAKAIRDRGSEPINSLAEEFGVSFNTVWRIRNGISWGRVLGTTKTTAKRSLKRLSTEERQKAKVRLERGEKLEPLAKEFGVGVSTMCRIRKEIRNEN